MDAREALLAGGLEDDGGGGSPVTHFKGRMGDFEATEVVPTNQDGTPRGNPYTSVVHKITELAVLASREPFDFVSMELPISASAKKRTKWGIWVASIARVCGIDLEEARPEGKMKYPELFDRCLRGRMVEIKSVIHQLRRKDNTTQKWGDTDVPCWELVGVEGAGQAALTPEQGALNLLVQHGTDTVAFMQAVLGDPVVSADKGIINAVSSNTWIPAMIAAGKVVASDGGYTLN